MEVTLWISYTLLCVLTSPFITRGSRGPANFAIALGKEATGCKARALGQLPHGPRWGGGWGWLPVETVHPAARPLPGLAPSGVRLLSTHQPGVGCLHGHNSTHRQSPEPTLKADAPALTLGPSHMPLGALLFAFLWVLAHGCLPGQPGHTLLVPH